MDCYKKYCLCGTIFLKDIPSKHKTTVKHKKWAEKNPTTLKTQKYLCDCGSIIAESGLKTHLTTDKHKNWANPPKTENLIDFDAPILQPSLKPSIPDEKLDKDILKEIEDYLDKKLDEELRLSKMRESIIYECGCGSKIAKSGMKKHMTTKKHKEWETN